MLQGLKDLFKQFLKPSGHSTEVIIPVGGAVVENVFNSCDKLSHCLIVIILQVQLHSAQHHGTTDVLIVSWNIGAGVSHALT